MNLCLNRYWIRLAVLLTSGKSTAMKSALLVCFTVMLFSLKGQCQPAVGCDTLDINRVEARINSNGTHFAVPNAASCYRIPKSTSLNTIYNMSLWFGGLDIFNAFYLSAETYTLPDFQPGPVSLDYTGPFMQQWDRVWKLNRTEVNYHVSHWNQTGYIPIPEILEWPGNGDTANGQTEVIAPYKDVNLDGKYTPMQGDYPLIPGDQAIFFVYNDDLNPTLGLSAQNLKVEVRGMAYAFDCPTDSALMYTTFFHYDIVNRSNRDYYTCSFGLYADPEIGFSGDDYIGCDVGRSTFYAYNGKNTDGFGNQGYGKYPPAQGFTLLKGPLSDPDGLDNPAFDSTQLTCGYAVNGTGFGDQIPDNEALGLTGFMAFQNTKTGPQKIPETLMEYLYYLQGIWADGTPLSYGGYGHPAMGATGTTCRFMYPGTSDACNWGTQGILPAGYTTGGGGSGPPWTEAALKNNPDNCRGLGISGPFTFHSGDVKSLDLALISGRNYADTGSQAALPILFSRIDNIRAYFRQGQTPCGQWYAAVEKKPERKSPEFRLFPNPAKSTLNIEYSGKNPSPAFSVINMVGLEVLRGRLKSGTTLSYTTEDLPSGIYFFRTEGDIIRKFIISK